jgi:quinolinate synthase
MKEQHPDAEFIAHPECEKPVLLVADFIGSTTALLKHTQSSPKKKFIVATESGILHQMQKNAPDKTYIPAPSIDATCGCNDCAFMKLNTMEKLYLSLKHEKPDINLSPEIMDRARQPILRMLELSK